MTTDEFVQEVRATFVVLDASWTGPAKDWASAIHGGTVAQLRLARALARIRLALEDVR